MFYPEGLVDFALEKSFIPKLPFFLLHRWVQKWLFTKYCPHFSFITLIISLRISLWEITSFFSSEKEVHTSNFIIERIEFLGRGGGFFISALKIRKGGNKK